MRLNPPGSSSDLETARQIAKRLSQAAYGRSPRAWQPGTLTAPVAPAGPPLEPLHRPLVPSAPEGEATPPPAVPAEPPPVSAEGAPANADEPASPPAVAETRPEAHPVPSRGARSRVDALLEQALGRAAALHPSGHRAEPATAEPFVPLPPAPEPPPAASWADEHEEQTDPAFRVAEEIRDREWPRDVALPPDEDEEPGPEAEAAPAPGPAVAVVPDTAEELVASQEEPVEAQALVEEEVEPPPPPARPEWPETLERCLLLAPEARGVLVAGADGRLVASIGQWPAAAAVVAGRLVPLIAKAPKAPTEDPLAIKLGANVLSSWQFEEDGERLTAAFVADAALPAKRWPELKTALRR